MRDEQIAVLRGLLVEMEPLAKYRGGLHFERWCCLRDAIDELEKIAGIGHWIEYRIAGSGECVFRECSGCSHIVQGDQKPDRCPNCGKKMEE